MKISNTILINLLLFANIAIYSQATLPHSETFDNPSGTYSWGSSSWVFDGNTASVSGQASDAYLSGPIFNFSSLSELPTIEFTYVNSAIDGLILQVTANGGSPVTIWTADVTTSELSAVINSSNVDYQVAQGAWNVTFSFIASPNVDASIDNISIIEGVTSPGVDVTYTYDLAGNRIGKDVIIVALIQDNQEITQLEKELTLELADANEESLFDEEPLSALSFNVYPNPTNEYINIRTSNKSDDYTLGLYDMSGKLISTKTLSGSNERFDLSGNLPGTYYLAIQSKIDQLIYKVIKI